MTKNMPEYDDSCELLHDDDINRDENRDNFDNYVFDDGFDPPYNDDIPDTEDQDF
jgi:hypothetical protein